jgi:ATP-dependent HslUV protease ATP-binding subunit HslU
MERLLDEVSFQGGELPDKRVTIDEDYVRMRLADITQDADLSRYVL